MSAESQLATMATELQSTRSALESQNLEAQKRIKMLESSLSIALESNEQLKLQHSERGLELIRAESMLSLSVLQSKRQEFMIDKLKRDLELALHAAAKPATAPNPSNVSPGAHRKPPSAIEGDSSEFAHLSIEDLRMTLKHEKTENELLRSKVAQSERRIDDLDADVNQLHTMVAKMKELLRRQDEKLQNERQLMNEELKRAQMVLTGRLSSTSQSTGLSRTASFSATKRPDSPPSVHNADRVASITIEPSVLPPMSVPLPRRPSFMDSPSRGTSPDPRTPEKYGDSSASTLSVRAVSGRNLNELRKMLGTSQGAVPPASSEEKGGWLNKEGGLVRNWKKRWFVYRQGKLLYFTDHHCKELKGEIVLTQRSHVADAQEHTKKEFSFGVYDLNNSGRTYFLQAGSKQDADDWIAFLSRKISTLA